jgi:hypothetical protein
MLLSVLLITHVCGATIGILSGFLAIMLRKGSGSHGAAGTVFLVSMLTMSSTAVYIASFLRPVPINVLAGGLTFYVVSTGWLAARRRSGGTNAVDVAALCLILGVAIIGFIFGVQANVNPAGATKGVPVVMYFVFASIALLLGVSDVRMLMRGGVVGARRIGRHLWRMSLGLMIATFSLYPGRPSVFPKAWRDSNLLYIPHVLLVGAVLLYLVRNKRQQRGQRAPKLEVPRAEAMAGSAVGA